MMRRSAAEAPRPEGVGGVFAIAGESGRLRRRLLRGSRARERCRATVKRRRHAPADERASHVCVCVHLYAGESAA